MRFSYLDFSTEISEELSFTIPSDIINIERFGYYIIISPSNGTWIVLENKKQVDVLELFKQGLSIKEVTERFNDWDIIQFVVCQIVGRHFEKTYDCKVENQFSLRIYLTNNCNLRCTHCFMYAGNKMNNELSTEEILGLISIANNKGANKLILTGGEVCLSDSFIPAVKYANSLGMYVQVLSNGTYWTPEMIDELYPYIDDIQISVDGYDEKTNAQIRGIGTFQKSLDTVEIFVSKGVYTTIVTTPSYETIENAADRYVEFGKNLVKKFGIDNFCIMYGNEIINGRNVKADKEKNEQYKKSISQVMEQIYPNYELTAFIRNHQNGRIIANCGYGTMTVSATGDLYFCGRIFEVKKYGNIRDLSEEEVFTLRNNARENSQIYNIIPCKTCELRFICGGGCRVSNIPQVTQIDLLKRDQVFERECNIEEKENLYRMMIESNDYLFW